MIVSLRAIWVALLWGLLPLAAAAEPSASDWVREEQVELRLIAAQTAVGDAGEVRLGVQFRLAPGWKTYWRSPGDAGLPMRLDWSGSRNLEAVELRWPVPERYQLLGLDTFAEGTPLTIVLTHKDGSKDEFQVNHTYNAAQIEWYKAGSALNLIKKQVEADSGYRVEVRSEAAIEAQRKRLEETFKKLKEKKDELVQQASEGKVPEQVSPIQQQPNDGATLERSKGTTKGGVGQQGK